jgi:hypothetical protein
VAEFSLFLTHYNLGAAAATTGSRRTAARDFDGTTWRGGFSEIDYPCWLIAIWARQAHLWREPIRDDFNVAEENNRGAFGNARKFDCLKIIFAKV